MRLAGTVRQYSKKAIPHEKRMTQISGHPVEIFISASFKCPYQANVMKTFEKISMMIVQIPFIADSFFEKRREDGDFFVNLLDKRV